MPRGSTRPATSRAAPKMASDLKAKRNEKDRRVVELSWKPAEGATSYLIRYGIDASKLYHHHLIRGATTNLLTLYSLNNEPGYFFRIDALNDSGTTVGTETIPAP